MEQGRGKAAVAEGDVKKTGAETVADVVQACVGAAGTGGAASPRAGSPVAAAADLEVKKVAVSDSAVPELGVTASSSASHGSAEAGGEHVHLQEVEAAGMKRKLANTGFKDPYESDSDVDAVYEFICVCSMNLEMMWTKGTKSPSLRRKPRRSGRRGRRRTTSVASSGAHTAPQSQSPRMGFMRTLCRMHTVYRVRTTSRSGQSMQPS